MRRICFLFCLFPFLCIGAAGRQNSRYTAFVIESSCGGAAQDLLEGLYDRGIRCTFLLQGSSLENAPEVLQQILADGHEVGCRGYSGSNMTLMSRRTMAGEIIAFQSLLPENYPLKLFCPPGGCSDGVRQVAEARKLGIVSWCADLQANPETIRDGDLILIRDDTPMTAEDSLAFVDKLMDLGFQPVTVTQLAKLRSIPIEPGCIYSRFPPKKGGLS
jgi:peptidoglycan/xylan/chitin deacetylase (PgdA/CDA1 family)